MIACKRTFFPSECYYRRVNRTRTYLVFFLEGKVRLAQFSARDSRSLFGKKCKFPASRGRTSKIRGAENQILDDF